MNYREGLSNTRARARESFTAEERQQLAEIGQAIEKVRGSKKAAVQVMASIPPEQRDLMIRWVAYRLSGGR